MSPTPTSAPAKAPVTGMSAKPLASTTLYPIRVSYFPKEVARADGQLVTIHELSISRLFYAEGAPDHRSLTINRTDAMKLISALEEVYRASFHAADGDGGDDEDEA